MKSNFDIYYLLKSACFALVVLSLQHSLAAQESATSAVETVPSTASTATSPQGNTEPQNASANVTDAPPRAEAVPAGEIQAEVTTEPNYKRAPGRINIPDNQPHYVAHRFYEERAGGWGWIRPSNDGWKKAKWIAIKETPGKFTAPHRAYGKLSADHNHEYKMLGRFADYQVYDPSRDEMMDVFILEGYEPLGLQPELPRKPGPPERFRSRKSGAFSRGAGRTD